MSECPLCFDILTTETQLEKKHPDEKPPKIHPRRFRPWKMMVVRLAVRLPSWELGNLYRPQPPVGHPKIWWKVGESSQNALEKSRFRSYTHTQWFTQNHDYSLRVGGLAKERFIFLGSVDWWKSLNLVSLFCGIEIWARSGGLDHYFAFVLPPLKTMATLRCLVPGFRSRSAKLAKIWRFDTRLVSYALAYLSLHVILLMEEMWLPSSGQ